jgi:hypothetical protein
MKKNFMNLNLLVLGMSLLVSVSCSEDEEPTPPEVVASKIKTISFDYGAEVESWTFYYDENDRVTSIDNVWNGGTPEEILYDYSVANQLTIDKGGNITVYELDSEGRIIKEFWDEAKTEYQAYEYNSDGMMNRIIEHYGGTDHLKYDLTIVDNNITNRIRYEDDGTTVREDREFSYTIADNVAAIHQIYQVDSEWKNVGGLYGKQSAKLVEAYVRQITSDPTSSYGATYEYTFDEKNRVATQTKNGTGSGGPFAESWSYTYYED